MPRLPGARPACQYPIRILRVGSSMGTVLGHARLDLGGAGADLHRLRAQGAVQVVGQDLARATAARDVLLVLRRSVDANSVGISFDWHARAFFADICAAERKRALHAEIIRQEGKEVMNKSPSREEGQGLVHRGEIMHSQSGSPVLGSTPNPNAAAPREPPSEHEHQQYLPGSPAGLRTPRRTLRSVQRRRFRP